MSDEEIKSYIQVKIKYFHNIYVCQQHLHNYASTLKAGNIFKPYNCCLLNSKPDDSFKFKLKLESFGSYCLILGINKSVSFQEFTQVPTIKASGVCNATLEKFLSNQPQDVKEAFDNLIKVNSA